MIMLKPIPITLLTALIPIMPLTLLPGCAVQPDGLKPPKLELTATLATPQSTFLRGESINELGVTFTLTNTGDKTATVTDFDLARETGDLTIEITGPEGKPIAQVSYQIVEASRDWHFDIKGAGAKSATLRLKYFGYQEFYDIGEHRIQVTFTPRPKASQLVAKPIRVTVVGVKESDILSTHVAGAKIDRLNGDTVALLQQIAVGGKVYLYHRIATRKDGRMSDPHRSMRLAELPGKVEMKVEGAYGAGNPLTITYKDANSPTGMTKLVINSIDGMPWTEEEERLRQERLRPKKDIPPNAPAPRPVKP